MAASAGFLLPLASTASLVLVLSSLSLQAMALQERRQVAMRQRLQGREDRLLAAAQAVAGGLQRRHRCLIALPQAAWVLPGQQASACAKEGDVQALMTGESPVAAAPYSLLQYCPQLAPPPEPPDQSSADPEAPQLPEPMLEAQLLLEILEQDGAAYRSAARLLWSWGPGPTPRLRGFQHLGLRSAEEPVPSCSLAAAAGNP